MDPVLEDDLKRRRLLQEQVQEYIEQQNSDDNKSTIVRTGPMAGRSVQQLETSESPTSSTSRVFETGAKGKLIPDTCVNTAGKIDSNLAKKAFNPQK